MLSNNVNSLEERSAGDLIVRLLEKPNSTFIQERKKKVGPNR